MKISQTACSAGQGVPIAWVHFQAGPQTSSTQHTQNLPKDLSGPFGGEGWGQDSPHDAEGKGPISEVTFAPEGGVCAGAPNLGCADWGFMDTIRRS